MAARGVESIPWRYKLLAGAGAGGAIGAFSDNEDLSFGEKVGRGMTIGLAASFGAGVALRGAGQLASSAASIGKMAVTGKAADIRRIGLKALTKPGTLMLGGAIAGAAIAPSGYKAQGAMIGGAAGLAYKPAVGLFKGYQALGRVPGAQTTALLAAAAAPVAASAMFGAGAPEGEGFAVPGMGGTMDYEPMSGNMQDKMFAMNATGDVVLGLHGRQHG